MKIDMKNKSLVQTSIPNINEPEVCSRLSPIKMLYEPEQPERPANSPVRFNNYLNMDLFDKEKNDLKNNTMFVRIVYLHQMIGLTYGGWQPNKNYSVLRKYVLLSYEFIIVAISFAVYFLIEDTISQHLFDSESNKIITRGIVRLAGSVTIFQMFTIRGILFFNGNKLIDGINTLFKSLNSSISYRNIILFVLVHSTLNGISGVLVYLSKESRDPQYSGSILNFGLVYFNFVFGCVGGLQMTAITVLLMILSKIYAFRLKEQSDSMRKMAKISQICRQMIEFRDSVEMMNRLIGLTVFIKIVINGVFMSSTLCALADNLNRHRTDYHVIGGLVTVIISSNLDLFATCRASQLLINGMWHLCQTTEERISNTDLLTNSDKQKFDLILSLRDKICFRTGQIFDISLRTYLYVINVTATYAIILIQTD